MSWSYVHRDDVEATVGRYPRPFDGEALSVGRNLGTAAGVRAIGAWHETLAPGVRTSRLHAHLHEEELVYVLEGQPTVRVRHPDGREERVALRPDHFVAFPAGTGVAHSLSNDTDAPVVLLVIGGRHPADRVRYPEDPDLEAWRRVQGSNRSWPSATVVRGTPYRIDTERLTLRPLGGDDTSGLFDLAVRNRERLRPFLPWAEREPDLDQQLAVVRRFRAAFESDTDWVWGIFRDGRLAGMIDLHPCGSPDGAEVGYWLDGAAEGRGLAREAVAAVLRAGLGPLGKVWIEARILPSNPRSRRLVAALGLTHEATLAGRMPGADGPRAAEVWTATRDALPQSAAAAFEVRMVDALGRTLADPCAPPSDGGATDVVQP